MWAIFMQPLFAALIVALVYHLDHASQGWLRLFVLPVPRWTIPAAKLAVVARHGHRRGRPALRDVRRWHDCWPSA